MVGLLKHSGTAAVLTVEAWKSFARFLPRLRTRSLPLPLTVDDKAVKAVKALAQEMSIGAEESGGREERQLFTIHFN